MSLDAIMWVWDSKEPASPTDRAVLLALARHADMDGRRIWPSVQRIVRMTGLSKRTVQDARRRLLEAGHIEEVGHGPKGTVHYLITGMQESAEAASDAAAQSGESRAGVQESARDDASAAPESSGKVRGQQKENPPSSPRDTVWAHYVSVMAPRRTQLDPEGGRIIDEALRVATVDECCGAIDGCAASPFHMGENDRRKKYNGLSHILRGRKAGGAAPPRTTRETIDFFLDRAPSHGGSSSATPAEISAAKRAVLDGITYPGDEHVAKRGEEAVAWLASEVGIRWDETARKWVTA